MHLRTSLAGALVLSLASVSAPQGDADPTRAALRARAERPAEARPTGWLGAGLPAGNRLFFRVGGDNAECVRAIPDVTGDGLDEIVVGIGESGTDNVFCLDGASSGAATVVWSLQTDGGLSGGSCYGDQAIVPVSDTEGNGLANVLLATAWGGRTAYDLDTLAGGEVWRFDTFLEPDSGWVYSLCEVADVTGDGVPEYAFAVGSDNDGVYLVDGASPGPQATVLWKYAAGDAAYAVRNLGDVNGNGSEDVLAAVGDFNDHVVCLESDTTLPGGSVIWSWLPGASVYAAGVLTDVTGDNVDEALVGLWSGAGVRCLDGATGAVVWASTTVSDNVMQVNELEDVTGDGTNEVIVASWENAVIVLDGSDGSQVWKRTVGTLNNGDVWTARAIDDLNGDGRQDVIAGSFDTHVYALDGDTGDVFWAYDTGNRVFSVAPVGDLNGDGRPEVAAGTQDTTTNTVVHVLEGDADIPFPGITFVGDGQLGSPFTLEITGPAGWFALPMLSPNTGSTPVPGFGGTLLLGAPLSFLATGPIPVGGAYELSGTLPTNPALAGMTRHLQGLAFTFPPITGDFTVNTVTVTLQ